jgi:hypothetical protein
LTAIAYPGLTFGTISGPVAGFLAPNSALEIGLRLVAQLGTEVSLSGDVGGWQTHDSDLLEYSKNKGLQRESIG